MLKSFIPVFETILKRIIQKKSIGKLSKYSARTLPKKIFKLIQFRQSHTMSDLREPYPEIEPYDHGMLQVSDLHTIYYEQSGNKDGVPALFIHGGPGGGTSGRDRRHFNPEEYRIIVFDQRGAGKSTPPAELKDNTTWTLVSDIEKIREKLGIEKWVVFGGSWGSTLSLTYAIMHPERVRALVLRGIFTLRQKELKWFYQEGTSFIFPDAYDNYKAAIPEAEQGDLITAFYERLTSDDEKTRIDAARAWSTWEMSTSTLFPDPSYLKRCDSDLWVAQFARIECHYFVNKGFYETDSWLLDNVEKISHIPTTIVQGRYDVVCPMTTAWELHKRLPKAEFHIIPDAGHSAKEKGIASKLVEATDKYAKV